MLNKGLQVKFPYSVVGMHRQWTINDLLNQRAQPNFLHAMHVLRLNSNLGKRNQSFDCVGHCHSITLQTYAQEQPTGKVKYVDDFEHMPGF